MTTGDGLSIRNARVSRRRLDRLHRALRVTRGPAGIAQLEAVLASIEDPVTAATYLEALCTAWLGPVIRRSERSDRGRWHRAPERVWRLDCQSCESSFTAARWDARYCSPACRQSAYRQRDDEAAAREAAQ